MARVIVYYAHPGHRASQVNRSLAKIARDLGGTTFVDLYAEYPRFEIDIDAEQQRLLDHDVVVIQCPLFWYSTPSIVKEWQDLVLEQGFAYGKDSDRLKGKTMLLALSAAGPESAYSDEGYQRFPLRTFLTPLEQTARLCKMQFTAPYVLYESLRAGESGALDEHVAGYRRLLEALRDDAYDFEAADAVDIVAANTLPLRETSHG